MSLIVGRTFRLGGGDWKFDDEPGTVTVGAVQIDRAAVALHYLTANGEPEPAATAITVAGFIEACEATEDGLGVGGVDAWPVVSDSESDR